MDISQTIIDNYTTHIEPILDGMSNGEATLFGLVFTFLGAFIVWLVRKIYKTKQPTVLNTPTNDENTPVPEQQTTGSNKSTSRGKNPHSASSIQATKPLPHTSNTKLFGRTKELTILTRTWNQDTHNIIVLKAMGGTGKTALLKHWLDGFNDKSKRTPPDKIYTWSFYSQGSSEEKQASADEFFDAALQFFNYTGDKLPSAHDKGIMLAELINQQRTLLVLDGLEPLQHPVGSMHGELKDQGLQALLRQLAAHNQGLCLISSRQWVEEIKTKPLALSHPLDHLQTSDGVELLQSYGVTGSQAELETAVKEVAGHALVLNLLGNYLKTVYQCDIRQRDKIPALTAERSEGNHAEHVMQAYEQHLHGTTALSILYMMGLFDRPATQGAIQHLRQANIPQLSDKLGDDADWHYALADLCEQNLLNSNNYGSDTLASPETSTVSQADTGMQDSLDTHPLIRDYFGKQLKHAAPDAWQYAHRELYDYYQALPKKQQPDTLAEMEPLFAAIAHGCAAGMHQQALEDVYWSRIRREDDMYIGKKLGAFGAELSALSHFFSQPWQHPAKELSGDAKADVLNWAAFNLRALGRLQEAVEPMQAGLELYIAQANWKYAASGAISLSELQLTRGEVSLAVQAAQQSVELADKSDDAFPRMATCTTLADVQHQAGQWTAAEQQFKTAETLQQQSQPEYDKLYSLRGYQYCDLLLSAGKWQEVQQRAEQTLKWVTKEEWLLDIALDQLSLGKAATVGWVSDSVTQQTPTLNPIYKIHSQQNNSPTESPTLNKAEHWLNLAVAGLRKSGYEYYLPLGLLARANYHRLCLGSDALAPQGNGTNAQADTGEAKASLPHAIADLQEAHDIAQRSGMRLHLCDYHLEAARLALTIGEDIHKQTAQSHIQKAKQLIEITGYKRRLPELEYLEAL